MGTALQEVRYDELGRLKGGLISNDGNALLFNNYTYTDAPQYKTSNQVATLNIHSADGTYSKTIAYVYDANGNITRDGNVTYKYDALNQLIRVNDPDINKTTKYYYDTAGNILKRVEYTYVVPENEVPTVQTPTDVVSYQYKSTFGMNTLSRYNGQIIDFFSALGCPSIYRGKDATWSQKRNLESIELTSGTAEYTYDANGMRQSKTVGGNTTYFGWNGSNLTYQEKGTEKLYYYYDTNGSPIAFKYADGTNANNGTYYYVKNLQGDIIAIQNTAGNIVTEYKYDAWGKLLSTTGTLASSIGTINPLRYRGYYYDTETSFYYLQSRYYDANVGRFINADDANALIGGFGSILGANVFAYCSNNPVNTSDPFGLIGVDSLIMGAVSAIINMLVDIFSQGFVFFVYHHFSLSGFKLNVGSIIWAGITGFAAGIIMSSSFKRAMQMLAGAVLGAINYIATCIINKSAFDLGEFLFDIGLGILTAAICGKGLGASARIGGDIVFNGERVVLTNVRKMAPLFRDYLNALIKYARFQIAGIVKDTVRSRA